MRIYGFTILCIAVLVANAATANDGYIHHTVQTVPSPRNSPTPGNPEAKIYITYSCHGLYGPINCGFKHELTGVKDPVEYIENNGGHTHYDDRPLTHTRSNIEFAFDTSGPNTPYLVEGQTINDERNSAFFIQTVPEVAGTIAGTSYLYLPFPYFCLGAGCLDLGTVGFKTDYIARIKGFVEMPPGRESGNSAAYHELVRGGTLEHPIDAGHWGRVNTIRTLERIAKSYYDLTTEVDGSGAIIKKGNILSINDMSLKYGGKFDVKGYWTTGSHDTHREGIDVDLNRKGIDCAFNFELRVAVNNYVSNSYVNKTRKQNQALACETPKGKNDPLGPYYHIYFPRVNKIW